MASEIKPKIYVFNISVEGHDRAKDSITCPHYELKVVLLKPELIRAFAELDLTYKFKLQSFWHQGEPEAKYKDTLRYYGDQPEVKGKSLSQTDCTGEAYATGLKVIQIGVKVNPTKITLKDCLDRVPRQIIGVIGDPVDAFNGRFIVFLLKKEEALELERMVLEFEGFQQKKAIQMKVVLTQLTSKIMAMIIEVPLIK